MASSVTIKNKKGVERASSESYNDHIQHDREPSSTTTVKKEEDVERNLESYNDDTKDDRPASSTCTVKRKVAEEHNLNEIQPHRLASTTSTVKNEVAVEHNSDDDILPDHVESSALTVGITLTNPDLEIISWAYA